MKIGNRARELHCKEEGDCWICVSHKPGVPGYPLICRGGKQRGAHRYVYEKYIGPIPKGMLVLHKCDNKLCLNISHLELGTQAKNAHDAVERGLWRKGENRADAKLKEKDIPYIRSRPMLQKMLAKKYGVIRQTISAVQRGKSWNHVKGEN